MSHEKGVGKKIKTEHWRHSHVTWSPSAGAFTDLLCIHTLANELHIVHHQSHWKQVGWRKQIKPNSSIWYIQNYIHIYYFFFLHTNRENITSRYRKHWDTVLGDDGAGEQPFPCVCFIIVWILLFAEFNSEIPFSCIPRLNNLSILAM